MNDFESINKAADSSQERANEWAVDTKDMPDNGRQKTMCEKLEESGLDRRILDNYDLQWLLRDEDKIQGYEVSKDGRKVVVRGKTEHSQPLAVFDLDGGRGKVYTDDYDRANYTFYIPDGDEANNVVFERKETYSAYRDATADIFGIVIDAHHNYGFDELEKTFRDGVLMCKTGSYYNTERPFTDRRFIGKPISEYKQYHLDDTLRVNPLDRKFKRHSWVMYERSENDFYSVTVTKHDDSMNLGTVMVARDLPVDNRDGNEELDVASRNLTLYDDLFVAEKR